MVGIVALVDLDLVLIEVCRLRVRVERMRWQVGVARRKRERDMTKLSMIGDRIAAKMKAHNEKADEWARRLDAIDQREPQAFAVGDAVIAEREGDIRQFESDMKQLSNLPLLSSSETSEPVSAPRSTDVAGKIGGTK